MMKNEGTIDRVLRVVGGAALLSIAFIGPQTPVGYIGIVPIVTGLIGWCPIYQLFGFNTCPIKNKNANM